MPSSMLKDPDEVLEYRIVWCAKDGTNDGTASDTGQLQGDTINTSTWTVASGITKDSDTKNGGGSLTLRDIAYPTDTVTTIWLSGGTAGNEYECANKIVTVGNRTLERIISIVVKER